MPHKLLIELGISCRSELSAFVKTREVIVGEVYTITLSAKNIGTSEFPGAKVEGIKVIYRPHWESTAITTPDFEVSFPEIAPGITVEFYSDECVAVDEGTAWVEITMKANDEAEIECYQSPTSPMKPLNRWSNWFRVIGRENVRIIALLEGILKQLE